MVEEDDFVDDLAHSIEMTSLDLISLQQPCGADLRLLATVMWVSRNWNTSATMPSISLRQRNVLANLGPYFKPLVDIPHMSKLARDMLRKSLTALLDVTRRHRK